MTFVNELLLLRNKSVDYIHKILSLRGTGYEITDPANYEDEINDELYQLPRAISVSKHGHHIEYAIVVINIQDDKLSFYGIEIGESTDEETFDESDLTTETLCEIADLVKLLEK